MEPCVGGSGGTAEDFGSGSAGGDAVFPVPGADGEEDGERGESRFVRGFRFLQRPQDSECPHPAVPREELQPRMPQQVGEGGSGGEGAGLLGEGVFVEEDVSDAAIAQQAELVGGGPSEVGGFEGQEDAFEVGTADGGTVAVEHPDAVEGGVVLVDRREMRVARPQRQRDGVGFGAARGGIGGDRGVGALPGVEETDARHVSARPGDADGGREKEDDGRPQPTLRVLGQEAQAERAGDHGEDGHQAEDLVGLADHRVRGDGGDERAAEKTTARSGGARGEPRERRHARQQGKQKGRVTSFSAAEKPRQAKHGEQGRTGERGETEVGFRETALAPEAREGDRE